MALNNIQSSRENGTTLTNDGVIGAYCLSDVLTFTRYFFKQRFHRKFVVGKHHLIIADVLNRVLRGELTRVMINIAPRFGKTELAVKNFIACGFAMNPASKFIHLSYSDDLARNNSEDVQEIMNLSEYQRLFDAKPMSRSSKMWKTNKGGAMYAVSSGGQVTGFGAGLVDEEEDLNKSIEELEQNVKQNIFGGAIIIDDPIKPDDARSPLIRNKVNQKFETTIRNRVNSRKTPIIIIMQRLDENDLCGYLQKTEPDVWTVIKIPAIQYNENGEEEALWPFKMNLEELHKLRDINTWNFDTQYMQNPKPLEGLMYSQGFKTYDIEPYFAKVERKCYVDTADEGKDFLCAIIYDETPIGNYVVDILYTDKPMEYTEPTLAKLLTTHNVKTCNVESNNGGRGFARNVQNQTRILNNNKTAFKWFYQSQNKQSRIFSHSAEVQNLTYFPTDWKIRYPLFANAILSYKKEGGNAHDDAPDCLTGTIEMRKQQSNKNLGNLFY